MIYLVRIMLLEDGTSHSTHVGCHHENIWKLIDVIKREEDISRAKVLHIQQGCVPPTPNPVYARVKVEGL